MTPPFDRVAAVFAEVLDLEPDAAEALLRRVGATEPSVAAEVRQLLATHRSLTESDFLDTPSEALLSSLVETVEDPRPTRGDRVGRYRIEEHMGGGGMGQVYRAHDPRLNRAVAIKLLAPWVVADDRAVRRFMREARAASGLDHPHIATVYEVDVTPEGRPYIVMAHYPGLTLGERLADGAPLEVATACTIAGEVASALSAAHASGIVHRDVKPANVLLTPRGTRVVDFGIAWSDAADATRTLLATGTLPYMSPEQTRGADADASTDIWSLGVLLYEMLAGRRPFRAPGDALVQQIRTDDPDPLDRIRPELPAELIALVADCLARTPAARPSASQLESSLLRWSGPARSDSTHRLASTPGSNRERGPIARPTHPANPPVMHRLRRWWTGAAVAGALLAATVGLLRFGSPASRSDAVGPVADQYTLAVLPFTALDGPEAEVYTRGIRDDLQTRLSGIHGLQITSPDAADALATRGASSAAAEELGVRWVLDGSVATLEEQLRVNVRVVDPVSGRQEWGRSYLRTLTPDGLFTVEEEILSDVANRLGVIPGPGATAGAPPDDLATYRRYVEGRTHLARRTEAGARQAVEAFQSALAQSADFAPAWAGLADALMVQGTYGFAARDAVLPRARDAAERALAIQPDLVEAHASLGLVTETLDHDGPAALESYRRAIELQPSYLAAHQWMAGLLISLDRLPEARVPIQRAVALDPASPAAQVVLARWYQYSDSLDLALDRVRAALSIEPGMPGATMLEGELLREMGRLDEARIVLERALELPGMNPEGFPGVWVELSIVYRALGDSLRADQTLSALGSPLHPFVQASVETAVERYDAALALLESAPVVPEFTHIIRFHPVFDALRTDPRLRSILERYDAAWGLGSPPRNADAIQLAGQDTAGL